MKKTFFFLLLIISVLETSSYAIDVAGNITTNTTWTKTNNPYVITGTFQVFDNVTLTIEPGVIVKVEPNVSISIAGNIVAVGENSSPIKFTSNHPISSWEGIKLINSTGSIFKGCIFKNAVRSLSLDGISTPVIENNIFSDNTIGIDDMGGYQEMHVSYCDFLNNSECFSGIRTSNVSTFQHNKFTGNNGVFAYGYYFGTVYINDNNFIGNALALKGPDDGYGLGTVDLSNNWFGTTDTSIIDSLIIDKYDDVSLQIVNYNPIKTTQITNIGASIEDSCSDESNKTAPGICGCNVSDIDTDSDGVADCVDPDDDNDNLLDTVEDTNQNGLVDVGETSPINPDSDNDGLADGIEVNILGTDPNLRDTDGNGIPDGNEDNDGDGFTNAKEVQCDSDPSNSDSKCGVHLPFIMLLLNKEI